MRTVDVTAPGKLYALLLAIAGCFATIIVIILKDGGATEMAPITALLTLLIGYLVGNSAGAKAGHVSVPPFQPTPARQAEILSKILEEDLPFKEREKVERLVARTKQAEEGQ